MGFQCGLVGLPNSGKSTIFNAITQLKVEASAYPFCTIDPHHGVVSLEDARLNILQKSIGSSKLHYTTLDFVDIAGLVKGASHGEGLGNQFLSHISRVDAIAHIVRCFKDDNVSHPYETIDPVRDVSIVATELILKDLEWIENMRKRARNASKSGDAGQQRKIALMEPMIEALNEGREIRHQNLNDQQKQISQEANLLTAKPIIYLANIDENQHEDDAAVHALFALAKSQNSYYISFCGKAQAEISELEDQERKEFLDALGLDETGLQKIVTAGYHALQLVTFFTANENEAHAWTIPRNTPVHTAAGKVHSDFDKGFIKAEVVHIEDLITFGSMKALHDHGLIGIHGRDYLVNDGDVIFIHVR